jgi:hypothetical protein
MTSNRMLRMAAAFALAALSAQSQAVFVVSDFEDRQAANKFSQASRWAFISDADSHGNSVITSGDTAASPSAVDSNSFASPGANGSQACFKMAWVYGSQRPHGDAPDTSSYDPEVGLVTQVYDESLNVGADFTGATKVSFWAKAAKATNLRFAALTPEVADYAFWGDDFTIGTSWKQYSLDFSAKTFAQPEWRTAPVPFDIKRITGFQMVISQANNPGAGGTLWLDDVTVTGWAPKQPEETTGLRSARALRGGNLRVIKGKGVRIDGRKAGGDVRKIPGAP